MIEEETTTGKQALSGKAKTRRAGQIIRKGAKKFLLRVFTGRDANGKRLYYSETYIGTARQAGDHLTALIQRHKNGEQLTASRVTFGDFLDQWLNVVKLRVREVSSVHYAQMVDTYIRPAFGALMLANVTADRIQQHYAQLQTVGLSASTIAYVHTLLANIFDLALRRELIRRNPMIAVDAPRKEQREVVAMDGDQMRRFLTAAQAYREAFVFSFAFYIGARSCEYLALKWADVDWAGKLITIQRSIKWRTGGEWYLSEPKTPRSRRAVPLTDAILKGLTEHRTRQLEERMKAGSAWQGNDFIFATPYGEPIKPHTLRYVYKQILRAAGLPEDFQMRITRHSCATALMSGNVNPKVVSERLGHSNVKITLDTYSAVAPGLQQEASERLEKLVFG
jgi:integrase